MHKFNPYFALDQDGNKELYCLADSEDMARCIATFVLHHPIIVQKIATNKHMWKYLMQQTHRGYYDTSTFSVAFPYQQITDSPFVRFITREEKIQKLLYE